MQRNARTEIRTDFRFFGCKINKKLEPNNGFSVVNEFFATEKHKKNRL